MVTREGRWAGRSSNHGEPAGPPPVPGKSAPVPGRARTDAARFLVRDLDPQVGLEVEVNLVDDSGTASMRSPDVLDAIGDPSWAPELGRFNIEVNMPPRALCGDALDQMEAQLLASLKHADQRARDVGSRLAMVASCPASSKPT